MNTLTKAEALALMEKINRANHQKKPYVRVGERGIAYYDIEDCKYKIFSYVNVYSKTWSRRVAKLVFVNENNAHSIVMNLREAKKVLI
jgi:hypothetical protein